MANLSKEPQASLHFNHGQGDIGTSSLSCWDRQGGGSLGEVKIRRRFRVSIFSTSMSFQVVVSGVLYLKLKKAQGNVEDRSSLAMRILECNKQKISKLEAKASTILLLETFKDVEDLIFMKPLHIRVKLQCADHPTTVTNKETILTDSSINVDISLD